MPSRLAAPPAVVGDPGTASPRGARQGVRPRRHPRARRGSALRLGHGRRLLQAQGGVTEIDHARPRRITASSRPRFGRPRAQRAVQNRSMRLDRRARRTARAGRLRAGRRSRRAMPVSTDWTSTAAAPRPWWYASRRSSGRRLAPMPSQARRTRPCASSWPSTHAAVSTAIAKPRPCERAMIAVLTPSTRPRASSSGPPELPGLSGAVCWMTPSIRRLPLPRRCGRARTRRRSNRRLEAERVADRDRELADARRERAVDRQVRPACRSAARIDAHEREVGRRIVADDAAPSTVSPVGVRTRIASRARDDVAVRHHVAVGRDDEAGARAAAAAALAPTSRLTDRGPGALDHADHGARVRVEQVASSDSARGVGARLRSRPAPERDVELCCGCRRAKDRDFTASPGRSSSASRSESGPVDGVAVDRR